MNPGISLNFNHFLPPIVRHGYWYLLTTITRKYRIGKFVIEIPPNYALPKFQKWFKLYDRFLPVLVKNISSDKIIIDVGANIGDTTIALLQNCKNPIICFEPSDKFFPYLERNLSHISSIDHSRVKAVKKLVGTGSISGDLNHQIWGTAGLKISDNSISSTHVRLDEMVDDVSNILLLKTDTDGFDFDVINSAKKILSESEPILFWENEISEDFQYRGFNELYSILEKRGYKFIFIFDNFGNLISEENNFSTLKNINSYVYSMEKHNCTRTIYCTDVLACTEKYSLLVKQAISEYKREWINK